MADYGRLLFFVVSFEVNDARVSVDKKVNPRSRGIASSHRVAQCVIRIMAFPHSLVMLPCGLQVPHGGD